MIATGFISGFGATIGGVAAGVGAVTIGGIGCGVAIVVSGMAVKTCNAQLLTSVRNCFRENQVAPEIEMIRQNP